MKSNKLGKFLGWVFSPYAPDWAAGVVLVTLVILYIAVGLLIGVLIHPAAIIGFILISALGGSLKAYMLWRNSDDN